MLTNTTASFNEELHPRNADLAAENRILRQQMKGRVLLSDRDRHALAKIGKKLGKPVIEEIASIAKPDAERAWLDAQGVFAEDTAHLSYATDQQCAVATANVRDFLRLHQTWQQAGRLHAGILAFYRENYPRLDMTYPQIAQAISRLEGARLPLYNTLLRLNMSREPCCR